MPITELANEFTEISGYATVMFAITLVVRFRLWIVREMLLTSVLKAGMLRMQDALYFLASSDPVLYPAVIYQSSWNLVSC